MRVQHKGRFFRSLSFTLRAERCTPEALPLALPRVGWTITRRLGGSVVRHRIRRRLKEALRTGEDLQYLRPCTDYVFVAHPPALTTPFLDLQREITVALNKVHMFLDSNHSAKFT